MTPKENKTHQADEYHVINRCKHGILSAVPITIYEGHSISNAIWRAIYSTLELYAFNSFFEHNKLNSLDKATVCLMMSTQCLYIYTRVVKK